MSVIIWSISLQRTCFSAGEEVSRKERREESDSCLQRMASTVEPNLRNLFLCLEVNPREEGAMGSLLRSKIVVVKSKKAPE